MVIEDDAQPTDAMCGVDEAGRGALAGPVCAAAVELGPTYPPACGALLNDSKQLSPRERVARAAEIVQYADRWAVTWATAQEVDCHNVLRATLLAMRRAYLLLCDVRDDPCVRESMVGAAGGRAEAGAAASPPRLVIVDGPHTPSLEEGVTVRGVIKADATVAAVQAASILAKVHRDAWMMRAHRQLPQYGFDRHKGYPTVLHRQRIADHGASPIHRMSFRGVEGGGMGR